MNLFRRYRQVLHRHGVGTMLTQGVFDQLCRVTAAAGRPGHELQLGSTFAPAVPTELPTLTGPDGSPHRFTVHADAPGPIAITGEVVHSTAFMMNEPNDLAVGTDPTRPGTKGITEAPVRYEWDGEVGWGWVERSRVLGELT